MIQSEIESEEKYLTVYILFIYVSVIYWAH